MRKGILAALVIACLPAFVASEEERIRLGDQKDGFSAFEIMENVRIVPAGRKGDADLVLMHRKDGRDRRGVPDPNVDLFLDFDREPIADGAGRWENPGSEDGPRLIRGSGGRGVSCAAFQYSSMSVRLLPGRDSLFSPSTLARDFSISFWLYPTALSEGENVFVWTGTRVIGGAPAVQEFSCRITKGRLRWTIANLFNLGESGARSFSLEGRRTLAPRTWRLHTLRFDADTGLLEYLIDGIPEAVAYATRSGREDGGALVFRTGYGGGLALGGGFLGLMDEFVIRRDFAEVDVSPYDIEGGHALSKPIDTGTTNSRILSIESDFSEPGTSNVFFYYRADNDLRRLAAAGVDQDWVPFTPNRPLKNEPAGRFVRIKVELFPDGGRQHSPVISDLTVRFEKNPPPVPPARISAFPGDGRIRLSWSAVPEPDVQGYLLYYGPEPGAYNGADALDAAGNPLPSPVALDAKTTQLTLTGLRNGKIYYFAIACFDDNRDPLVLGLSREVSARPSRIYNEGPEKK